MRIFTKKKNNNKISKRNYRKQLCLLSVKELDNKDKISLRLVIVKR